MTDIGHNLLRVTTPNGTTHSHQSYVALDDGFPSSNGDREGTADEDLDVPDSTEDNAEAGSIVGVSMSRAQTLMKSPKTPASEKAKALEASRSYFEQGTSNGNTDDIFLTESPESHTGSTDSESRSDGPPSPWRSKAQSTRRQSVTRAILGDSQGGNRKRSSSGTTAIIEAIRKMLPDLPSYSGFSFGSKNESDETQDRSEDKQELRTPPSPPLPRARKNRSQTTSRPPRQIIIVPDSDSELSVPQKPRTKSRPTSIRRSTSDNSLYLKRIATGASEFDNVGVFSDVADMPNSRFKAITDNFAETSIRMPRLGSISHNSSRNSPARMNSDVTKRNTELNTILPADLSLPLPAESSLPGKSQYISSDTKHPMLKGALSRATGDLVIMGGYRGSVLRLAEPPYHQVWIPVKVGLNLRKVDLEVGLTHEDEERMEEKIVPSGMLSHIGPIDISRRLLKKMNKCPNVQNNQLRIHDYGYDWRLSPHFLSQKLIQYLETLECNQPGTPIEKRGALVVAHSLGGLITRHAVNQRPELFSGVVYAGSPMNCCNILGPLRNGDDVLLSSRVLTAQVNFTLRTSFALLPEDGRCFLNKETGERYDVDFFDPESWDNYHLSPCINAALPQIQPKDQRKSLVDSITESISSLSPSRPGKRTPRVSSGTISSDKSSENLSATSSCPSSPNPNEILKEKVHDAKEDIESAARHAGEHMQSPKHEAQDSLEPSMKSSSTSGKTSVATTVTIPKDEARAYLARTLAEVKQFKAELAHMEAHQKANRYPPHAIIFGKTVPTVYGAKVASREAIKYSDAYDDLAFAAGDGVVLASAAQLPQGYRCVRGGRVESDRGHIGLLGDLEGIGQCIAAVIEGRKRGIGTGDPL